jgi:hypothetical protein
MPIPVVPGDVIVRRTDKGPVIEHADPKTFISGEMLDEIQAGDCEPWAHLDGDVLTLTGINRRVVYRIDFDGYRLAPHMYPMEWPD